MRGRRLRSSSQLLNNLSDYTSESFNMTSDEFEQAMIAVSFWFEKIAPCLPDGESDCDVDQSSVHDSGHSLTLTESFISQDYRG